VWRVFNEYDVNVLVLGIAGFLQDTQLMHAVPATTHVDWSVTAGRAWKGICGLEGCCANSPMGHLDPSE
jgi:hypothetical protein